MKQNWGGRAYETKLGRKFLSSKLGEDTPKTQNWGGCSQRNETGGTGQNILLLISYKKGCGNIKKYLNNIPLSHLQAKLINKKTTKS